MKDKASNFCWLKALSSTLYDIFFLQKSGLLHWMSLIILNDG